jgi:hypothetical protein
LNKVFNDKKKKKDQLGNQAVRTIELADPKDEVVQVDNFTLPVSNSHVLAYVTQNGGFHLHDVRARSNILS